MTTNTPLKVHITGVNGLVGNVVFRHLITMPEQYDVYGSARRREPSPRLSPNDMLSVPDDHFHLADLTDAEAMRRAIAGMDVVLHIGAVADENQSWEPIHQANIIGTHNVLEACRLEGVQRLVFASSARVNLCDLVRPELEPYLSQRTNVVPNSIRPITVLDPTRPAEDYGASKVWGEACCHAYAETHGMSIIVLRVCAVQTDDSYHDPLLALAWCSHRDIAYWFEHALLATASPGYEIAYAMSDNRPHLVDIEHSRDILGYWPQDSSVWPPKHNR